MNNLLITQIPVIDSTNEHMKRLISDGKVSGGSFLIAEFQEAGRGHGSNAWHSMPGMNLLGSLYIELSDIPASDPFLISCIVSLALTEMAEEETRKQAAIKWPNDIYVENRKLAGLLIENTVSGNELKSSVIGIGLNVNQAEFPDALPNPVSLFQIDGRKRRIEDLATKTGMRILDMLSRISATGTLSIREAYQQRLYRLNEWSLYEYESKRFSARITGIDEYGRLVLETEGKQKIAAGFKEIVFL